VAFEGVAKLMARVKCAMLGWSALEDSLLKVTEGSAEKVGAGMSEMKEEG